jgi:hypothetical protein
MTQSVAVAVAVRARSFMSALRHWKHDVDGLKLLHE